MRFLPSTDFFRTYQSVNREILPMMKALLTLILHHSTP